LLFCEISTIRDSEMTNSKDAIVTSAWHVPACLALCLHIHIKSHVTRR